MATSYFTFGQSHVHSVDGFTYDRDVIVKITAENPRDVMVSVFGRKWAFEYEEGEIPDLLHWFPRGIRTLK